MLKHSLGRCTATSQTYVVAVQVNVRFLSTSATLMHANGWIAHVRHSLQLMIPHTGSTLRAPRPKSLPHHTVMHCSLHNRSKVVTGCDAGPGGSTACHGHDGLPGTQAAIDVHHSIPGGQWLHHCPLCRGALCSLPVCSWGLSCPGLPVAAAAECRFHSKQSATQTTCPGWLLSILLDCSIAEICTNWAVCFVVSRLWLLASICRSLSTCFTETGYFMCSCSWHCFAVNNLSSVLLLWIMA